MSRLFSALFSATALFGVALRLAHTRHRGGVTAFSYGAMLLFVIVSFFPSDIRLDFNIQQITPDVDAGEYYYTTLEACEEGIRRAISEELSLPIDGISVVLSGFEIEKMSAECVMVTLSGTAALGDYKRVERFVNEIGMGRCVLDVQIG